MKIQVIIGSTRPGRIAPRIAQWVAAEAAAAYASANEQFEVETVDLADHDLPFFNEAVSPRYNPNRQPTEVVQAWMDKLAQADGYIFVTPEYNHSITGVLKNAMDYLTTELAHKPAAVVSYGTVGGARAAEHLKLILLESGASVVPQATAIVAPQSVITEAGELTADAAANPYGPKAALAGTLTELAWWTEATVAARQAVAVTA